jgi:hypothetical protein
MEPCATVISLTCLNSFSGLIQATIYAIQTIILLFGFMIAWCQLIGLQRTTRGANSLEFVHGHREIMRIALEQPFLLTTLTYEPPSGTALSSRPSVHDLMVQAGLPVEKVPVAEMFHSLLINHMAAAHTQFRLSNVSPESWRGYEPDIADYFHHAFARARWRTVARYQPVAFRRFVDAMIPDSDRPREGSS